METKRQPKAAVLLATYNGERFLPEQLDSILNQTWENLELYIRDDGSSDHTLTILKKYESSYKNVRLLSLSEGNLGYPACFYVLSDLDIDADYFFFSDQDDVWIPDRIQQAIELMEVQGDRQMLLYTAAYTICNEKLEPVGQSPKRSGKFTLYNTLFDLCGPGFTLGFNRKARDFLRDHKPQHLESRDGWMSMLFSAFGLVIYNPEPCAFYRRHSNATASEYQTGFRFWAWRVQTFFFGGFASYKETLQDFYEVVGDKLSEQDRDIVYLFAWEKYFPGVFRKVFFPKRLRSNWIDELALRFVFLLGLL